ncbi:hypothetical protein BU16DRAFT_567321 [Lophium mytilinum]|uniref:Protein kinase domain-containing protein n=1 Tax=Lophium mytilinum TaxID=390894 RepID=A0A6A6QAP2_9PEZI|nr:hypothetical protein BU16DRAFT_567321 [Lophium mytilinum]
MSNPFLDTPAPPPEPLDPGRVWDECFPSRHLEFSETRQIPFEEGRVLGRGGVGIVHKTTLHGVDLAWKRTYTRVIGERQLNEMKILRQMRREKDRHIVELVGSYVRRGKAGSVHELGLLIWPVAYCDLGTLLSEMDQMNARFPGLRPPENNPEYMASARFLEGILRKRPPYEHNPYYGALKTLSQAVGCIAHAL